ncbi:MULTISPECIES: bifunctional UDP-2,4-diacetamido-2,4,6-trideoxy-beta-L-altropyranose hydrolase/GNAT family N-acetyltransferase [unclassified Pseudonocardia]|uniref:bifunctional UDP-2,4-diacetamido-2,4,6-trideoxy-beta-L-altropyranose hydrolase/GNAT family N-acetyltransferase n=1 Tax=unclassified Pseudonocardia TaxID=2619320 RepID=UPI00094AA972|nr:bifunctional UDP-2,4-diacetamido-2,4,6-trideoxy-beta-L-altropyranose hydrolase/GNAT family N-acetyltransferase [Pseudonocardia sp. Ae707_Ps1]OLM15827.1 N-Acetylneuraminate cytidylyltransferase [Pseudonocardia sp. Ae707_Ps1]
MRLLLRCDAGPSTGVGHAVRCAAVAEAATASGHEVFWSGRLDGLGWLWAGLAPGGPVPPGTLLDAADSADDLVALCRDHRIDAVHVDHYLLGTDLRAPLNAAGIALSTVEDFTTGRRPGDLVVDPNLGADDHPRPDDGSTTLLRGPAYAPLRIAARRARRVREVRDRDLRPATVGVPPRVLVVMGGTDAAGLLGRVVAALAAADVPAEVDVVVPAGRSVTLPEGGPARFRAIAPLPDLPAAMAEMDLVVSAAGTTVWELCCVGVPMALVLAADNQVEGYRTVVAAGAAAGLGGAADLADPEPGAAVLRDLLTGPGRRDALGARARTVVDGEGANRIVDALAAAVGEPDGAARREHVEHTVLASALHARPARLDDAEMLLGWRNDPETRRWSRSTGEIDLDAHRRWLAGSLDRTDRRLLVVSDVDGAVGTVRWDRDCTGWEVSITVAPERRGSGLAVPLLRAGEDALRTATGPGTPVIAVVHTGNAASARLFARAGYADDGTGPDDDGFRTLRRTL